jgi:hypothetical protein
VWWFQPPGVEALGRVALTRARDAIWTFDLNQTGAVDNTLYRVSLDGETVEAFDAPGLHHDLVEVPDGGVAYLAYDYRTTGDLTQRGERLMERRPDGTTREIFNAWDHFTYGGGLSGGEAELWPHGNAVDYVESEDAFLVSFLFLDGIAKIDRATGALRWMLGGEYSDFTLPDGGAALFDRQHQMHRLDDSLLVFVNGDGETSSSRVVEYGLDEARLEATEVWSYWPASALVSPILGSTWRWPGGNTMATFSLLGQLHEVSPTGALLWRLDAGGSGIGYPTWLDAL